MFGRGAAICGVRGHTIRSQCWTASDDLCHPLQSLLTGVPCFQINRLNSKKHPPVKFLPIRIYTINSKFRCINAMPYHPPPPPPPKKKTVFYVWSALVLRKCHPTFLSNLGRFTKEVSLLILTRLIPNNKSLYFQVMTKATFPVSSLGLATCAS